MNTRYLFVNADNGKAADLRSNKSYEVVRTTVKRVRSGRLIVTETLVFTHYVRYNPRVAQKETTP